MRRWPSVSLAVARSRTLLSSSTFATGRRWLSQTSDVTIGETVKARCGSSGSINISLHNLALYPPSTPLLIYLPPTATPASSAPSPSPSRPPLPTFLQHYPSATIHYRWSRSHGRGAFSTPLHWPTPLHDVAFGYDWITSHLAPAGFARRDIYLYASHLGAGLAASLALAETRPSVPSAVRGFVAHNGIYNWTMFLPDHRVNRPRAKPRSPRAPLPAGNPSEATGFEDLRKQMAGLFRTPSNLFDVFASPSLLFHTPGLDVPPSFTLSKAASQADELASLAKSRPPLLSTAAFKIPRRSRLVFPPRTSTLKIPEALLLYSTTPRASSSPKAGKVGVLSRVSSKPKGNTFETQALELAEMMRRSVNKLELQERRLWDEEFEDWDTEAERRIALCNLGEDPVGTELDENGQMAVCKWLDQRFKL